MYAAPLWGKVINVQRYKNILLSTQRTFLLRVTRAYRTASLEAVVVIACIPPIDLMVEKRIRLNGRAEITSELRKN